jgi:hypothetical protein
MSDREDLPFISLPADDTPLPASAVRATPGTAPAKPAPKPAQQPVDMVSKPTGRGTEVKQAPAPPPRPVSNTFEALVVESKPVEKAAPPPPAPAAPSGGAHTELDSLLASFAQQQKAIQDALRNYATVKRECDEIRAKLAACEHELAQTRQQLAEARAGADKSQQLQKQLDGSLLAHSTLSTENAKLMMRANELEEKLKAADERIAAALAALQKK